MRNSHSHEKSDFLPHLEALRTAHDKEYTII